MPDDTQFVCACIPYYEGQRYIRRAVEGLLNQTHRRLQVVVINDGDRNPPWNLLAPLRDPRLVRFDLSRNHGGPFFANAVVVRAVQCRWFLVQEQDDWSAPDRVERLLRLAVNRNADVALSAQYIHRQLSNGSSLPIGIRWRHSDRKACKTCQHGRRCEYCSIDTVLTPKYRYRMPHTALFSVSSLRKLGGYYAGLHLRFDSLLMNLLLMTGTVVHTSIPLYHRLVREDSITQAQHTGLMSQASQRERGRALTLYERAFRSYEAYLGGDMTSEDLAANLRRLLNANVPVYEQQELAYEASRLRALLFPAATSKAWRTA